MKQGVLYRYEEEKKVERRCVLGRLNKLDGVKKDIF